MRTVRTIAALRDALVPFRVGPTVGLVPTMGAFHEGHLSLFRAARSECDAVVVSLFLNPAQFADDEDFETYPRDEDRDARIAGEAGVDFLFVPSVDEMYPEGFQTWVEVERLSQTLEGEFRPGHFRGVATVCLRLFNIVHPQRAYFGQKDAQQAAVIEQLVGDLNLELEICVLPTVRDEDGVALSSRNVRLSPVERLAAAALPRALDVGADAYRAGRDAAAAAREVLEKNALVKPQYVDVARWNGRLVLAAAVRIGRTRLIDNVVLERSPQ